MSVYKFIELVGTSENSWEDAVKEVVETAGKTLKDLRVAEVKEMDVKIEDGKVALYRVKVRLSFKYHKD
ncbi:MAG: dodecin domain-containing protein [Thermodesulfobacteria bacterium]|nr:dodecin domain-containing protein [Thermodesulfobacteriota bacterium]